MIEVFERSSVRLSYMKGASGGAEIIEEISERFDDSLKKTINKERVKLTKGSPIPIK
ncbi:hypothetical protein KRE40_07455 [Elizabethkingia meningoseptica]|uniref:hypothetical protein n=1 Tax=Elizabethkingia meningoseptica TaxID=238 RepID=UPI0023AF57FD|nr:hypothetical protein [Elizabethkingia meningoseptica]MDE5437942.1 hypothetical protein [Elizabethkingia meningoseptica]MDE5449411.1 hypothetical protein [Elizabethkingia meningoseptica]MDE5508485.1 hypothetical protein [Elizabethkingia meningoseptica]MDE5516155.1 hypothetical protein [Elizabethkingia meningoseptica]MDN4035396.1 hypothetical protein [Elizabethkingia meningoseptica]